MDGEWWKDPSYDLDNNIITMDIENEIDNENEDNEDNEENEECIVTNRPLRNNSFIKCSRDLSQYFSNEQRLRHTTLNIIW